MKLIFSAFITLFLASNSFAAEAASTTSQDGNAIHYFTKYAPSQLAKDRILIKKEKDATKKSALKETFDKNVSGYAGEIKLQQEKLNAIVSNPASTKKEVKKAKKNLKALDHALKKISKQQLLADAAMKKLVLKPGKPKLTVPIQDPASKSPVEGTTASESSDAKNTNSSDQGTVEGAASSGTR